jgi:hypothetical protein
MFRKRLPFEIARISSRHRQTYFSRSQHRLHNSVGLASYSRGKWYAGDETTQPVKSSDLVRPTSIVVARGRVDFPRTGDDDLAALLCNRNPTHAKSNRDVVCG